MEEHKKNSFLIIWDYFKEIIAGFSLSGFLASIWTESIHGIAVIITGVLSTIAIDFTRKKYLPLAHKIGYIKAFRVLFKSNKYESE
jgi:hypothetical protein